MRFDKPYELVSPLLPAPEELLPDIREALASKWLSDGQFVRRLELRMSEVLDARHVVAVSSATLGLMLAIRALGWEGEVISPSFSFAGTAHAIAWTGCEPVLAEVDPETWLLDPRSVSRLVGPRTAGIIAIDAYGVPANLDALAESADGLPILVDAAHALGSRSAFRTQPRARVYSLHPTKTLVAGEGGLLATGDADLAARLRELRNFGFRDGQDAVDIGLNAKLPELSAILAYHQIELLPQTIEGRRAWDATYREVLSGSPGIRFQRSPEGVWPNHQYSPILIEADAFGRSRDGVAAELAQRNIVTRPYFSPPVHLMERYAGRLRHDDLTWTESLSASVLCLPVHPGEAPDVAAEIGRIVTSLQRPGASPGASGRSSP